MALQKYWVQLRGSHMYSSLTLNSSIFGPTPPWKKSCCTSLRVPLKFRFNNGIFHAMQALTCFEQETGSDDFLRSLSTWIIMWSYDSRLTLWFCCYRYRKCHFKKKAVFSIVLFKAEAKLSLYVSKHSRHQILKPPNKTLKMVLMASVTIVSFP